MKNRKLILILSLVLALTMSLGGTLAYLTDTDADVNTMTLGNVQIDQLEYERATGDPIKVTKADGDEVNSYKLQPFTQDKPLLPYVGELDWDDTEVRFEQLGARGGLKPFAMKNVVDKFVFVKNTGNTNAYVRTLIAFEAGSYTASEWHELVGISKHDTWDKIPAEDGAETIVEINGNKYLLMEFLYQGADNIRHDGGILPKNELTYPNLGQVYLSKDADNEHLTALDGNGNNMFDILVLSQAVQADGFEDQGAAKAFEQSFGNPLDMNDKGTNQNVVDWFMGIDDVKKLPKVHNVSDAAGLIAAAKEGGVIDLTGKTITLDGTKDSYLAPSADLKIIGGTIEGYGFTGETNYAANINKGNVVFENVTFKIDEICNVPGNWVNWAINVNINGTANVTFRNCTFTGIGCPIYQSGANTVVTIEDCTFEGKSIQAEIYSGDYQLGQDLIIKNCDFGTIPDVLHIYDYDQNPSSEAIAEYLNANGNTFTGVCKQTCE